MLIVTLDSLGIHVQCKEMPGHAPVFGGRITDSRPDRSGNMKYAVPPAWIAKKQALSWGPALASWTRTGRYILRELMQINGELGSVNDAHFGGRCFSAPVAHLLADHMRGRAWREISLSETGKVTPEALQVLAFHMSPAISEYLRTVFGAPNPARILAHDASADAHGSREVFPGPALDSVRPARMGLPSRGFWEPSLREEVKHSTFAELRGGIRQAKAFILKEDLRACHLLMLSDNTPTVAALLKGGARSPHMNTIMRQERFFPFLRQRKMTVSAEFRSGEWMIDHGVDGASRPT